VEQAVQGDLRSNGPHLARQGIHGAEATLQDLEAGGVCAVGFVEHQQVGGRDLLGAGLDLIEIFAHVHCIDHGHDAIELKDPAGLREIEDLHYRARCGQPGGLDEDMVEAVCALGECSEHFDKVFAHCAAHTAFGELEEHVAHGGQEAAVDADVSKLVLHNHETFTINKIEEVAE
jgi:hypothetical protein